MGWTAGWRRGREAADVTVVLTSCGRHDLLERTLASFRTWNTDRRVAEIVVVEDGPGDPAEICRRHGARLIRLGRSCGQIAAIETGYAEVRTPYIFHLEDDWEFYRGGFIERSRAVLAVDPSTLCVWLRAWDDTNGHPLHFTSAAEDFGVLAFGYRGKWHAGSRSIRACGASRITRRSAASAASSRARSSTRARSRSIITPWATGR
ncbi:glycosyltransferase [Methylobacterium gossipiicola]|uniref:Glycosyl transferase family 2 n=1 Tax=Methylobacterium gossipiicola TaxID=582675 RepID=A0A1I2WRU0_9HYPH|nr:glycosyltransferase [Methylobacterium gossipiicola]SFH03912.1 Glycosyl transferase family 2 [Methylobacterium gossipiicola]